MANETAFKGLQIFPQNLAKQQRRQMRGNGEWIPIASIQLRLPAWKVMNEHELNAFDCHSRVDCQAFYSSLVAVRNSEYI